MEESKLMQFEDGLGRMVQERLSRAEVEQIVARIRERIQTIPGAAFAYVHGSFIREGPSRDIDIAVYFGEMPRELATDRCLEASAVLSHELGLPVDVHPVDPESIPFAYSVASGRLLFTNDLQLSNEFEERAIVRYLDFQPVLRSILKDLMSPR